MSAINFLRVSEAQLPKTVSSSYYAAGRCVVLPRNRCLFACFPLGEAKSMHQPGKWWVGLLPIAALWVLANGVRTESVEADVASRAQAILAEAPDIASAMKATAL